MNGFCSSCAANERDTLMSKREPESSSTVNTLLYILLAFPLVSRKLATSRGLILLMSGRFVPQYGCSTSRRSSAFIHCVPIERGRCSQELLKKTQSICNAAGTSRACLQPVVAKTFCLEIARTRLVLKRISLDSANNVIALVWNQSRT